jgi:hypothetical protein
MGGINKLTEYSRARKVMACMNAHSEEPRLQQLLLAQYLLLEGCVSLETNRRALEIEAFIQSR